MRGDRVRGDRARGDWARGVSSPEIGLHKK